MNPYNFRKVFIRYVALLFGLMLFIYLFIILIYSWQVNKEVEETSRKQLQSVVETLNNGQSVNEGHPYFIVQSNYIVSNHTPFSTDALQSDITADRRTSFMWKHHHFYYQIDKGLLNDGSMVYSLSDSSDYEETKILLYNLLLVLLLITLVLIVGAAYYLAIKPVRAYELMLERHRVFIQNASHEMKTPLASVSLGIDYVNALEGTHLSDGSKNALSKMKNEVRYLQSLITRTLNIRQEDDAVMMINAAEVLDELIEQQNDLYAVKVRPAYEHPLYYMIAPDKLKQMVTILLDNAVKHNSPEVSIELLAKVEGGLRIEVLDNGQGIDAKRIERIFDRYYRGNPSIDGSGIGLTLLKELVTEMGGTIEVKSELNKKTSFILNL
ncbi:HAMP domain-containing histidine kinase [Macrococcus equipercicus]|uniref:histidine kinase n=1 Tax=Macrococcus equipercicus TaxID=69967 RepID=A0ABQ6R8V6_9STAP|nr:HAMP domain-containing sensor histidine kinase [Macrococcus equipercicus]KAA1039563.1 HAMP domain-containing histidine kinase [Macrococcus equipercicus]